MKNRVAAFFMSKRRCGVWDMHVKMTKFQELAKEAKAVYKIDKVALVNCEIFEKYLETFRIA